MRTRACLHVGVYLHILVCVCGCGCEYGLVGVYVWVGGVGWCCVGAHKCKGGTSKELWVR